MSNIPIEVIKEWSLKKKYIQDRLNKIKKRIKKYNKQLAHFEMRLRLVEKFEKDNSK